MPVAAPACGPISPWPGWHERAADAGNKRAMLLLAQDYAGANGLPPDYQRARIWFEQAADAEIGEAMAGLANLYRNGQGVDVNMITDCP